MTEYKITFTGTATAYVRVEADCKSDAEDAAYQELASNLCVHCAHPHGNFRDPGSLTREWPEAMDIYSVEIEPCDADEWRAILDDDAHDDEYPWMGDTQACPRSVIDVMIEHAPPTVGMWNTDDAQRVAAACRVTYADTTLDGVRHGTVTALEQVGLEYVKDQYAGADTDAYIAFDPVHLESIGANLVADENKSGRSIWVDCDTCNQLHHFDGAMVRGETTP